MYAPILVLMIEWLKSIRTNGCGPRTAIIDMSMGHRPAPFPRSAPVPRAPVPGGAPCQSQDLRLSQEQRHYLEEHHAIPMICACTKSTMPFPGSAPVPRAEPFIIHVPCTTRRVLRTPLPGSVPVPRAAPLSAAPRSAPLPESGELPMLICIHVNGWYGSSDVWFNINEVSSSQLQPLHTHTPYHDDEITDCISKTGGNNYNCKLVIENVVTEMEFECKDCASLYIMTHGTDRSSPLK
eukprot:20850_1